MMYDAMLTTISLIEYALTHQSKYKSVGYMYGGVILSSQGLPPPFYQLGI